MCRWPNGDLSFVSAEKEEDAIVMLDEWDNAEVAELTQVQNFMVDFRLTDGGELELQAFGEQSQDDIWDRAYPVLAQAKSSARETSTGDLGPSGAEIRAAVEAERLRLEGKKQTELADTELGKSIQSQLGAAAALINRHVKKVATEVLKKSPPSRRKQ